MNKLSLFSNFAATYRRTPPGATVFWQGRALERRMLRPCLPQHPGRQEKTAADQLAQPLPHVAA
uniref:hypothetical protein n=1 Tax=Candidatus Electronema sp. TaxID=2698783 RepID=UPI0040565A8B